MFPMLHMLPLHIKKTHSRIEAGHGAAGRPTCESALPQQIAPIRYFTWAFGSPNNSQFRRSEQWLSRLPAESLMPAEISRGAARLARFEASLTRKPALPPEV